MNYTDPRLSTSALLTIDAQCDFMLPGAVAEIPGSYEVIPNMTSILKIFRQLKLPIIHIVRLYLTDGSNVDLCRRNTVEDGKRIVAPNSSGADLVAELKPDQDLQPDAELLLKGGIQTWRDAECVMYKPRWGAFFQTALQRYLKSIDVDTLIFCGCNFPNCPRATIYEASERDYRIILMEDAISGLYDQGKSELHNIGVHIWSTQQLLDAIAKDFSRP